MVCREDIMMKTAVETLISVLLCAVMLFSVCVSVCGDGRPPVPEVDENGFVHVNGIDMEYAVYGAENSRVMLLFPPNGNDMHSFDGNVLPYLAREYKVITVSPRGTGRSGRGSGRLTFGLMASDIEAMLDAMGIGSVYIFGFSDGGNLGLVFTLDYPGRVDRLAVMGANINPLGTKPSSQIGIVFEYICLRIRYFFTKDPADALEGDIVGMMVGQPDLRFRDLEKIGIPVLNIYGQSDMMFRTHSRLITKHIPDCRELMVKGGGHSSCFDYTDDVIAPALLEFFAE